MLKIWLTLLFSIPLIAQDRAAECAEVKLNKAKEITEQFHGKDLIKIYQKVEAPLQNAHELFKKYPGNTSMQRQEVFANGGSWKEFEFELGTFAKKIIENRFYESGIQITPNNLVDNLILYNAKGEVKHQHPTGYVVYFDGYSFINITVDSVAHSYNSQTPVIVRQIGDEFVADPGVYGLSIPHPGSGSHLPILYVMERRSDGTSGFSPLEVFLNDLFQEQCPKLTDKDRFDSKLEAVLNPEN